MRSAHTTAVARSTTTSTPHGDLSPTIHDPIHQVSNAFVRAGQNLWVYTWLEPGAHLPEHFHPTLEERWEVLEGSIRLRLAGTWRTLDAQDGPLLVARGVRHEIRNAGTRTVLARAEVLPAGQLEEFLTDAAHAAAERRFTARGLPTSPRNAAWVAAFAMRHRDETVMTFPPPALQRALLPPLARFARFPTTHDKRSRS